MEESLLTEIRYMKILHLLKNNTFYSSINVSSLAIGLFAWLILIVWINDEMSYEGLNENSTDIYKVGHSANDNGYWYLLPDQSSEYVLFPETPSALSNFMKSTYSEVINSARIGFRNIKTVSANGKTNNEYKFAFGDTELLEIFKVPFLQGSLKTSFPDSHSVVISEKTAKKYFGSENPIGKSVNVDGKDNFVIRAVVKDMPFNYSVRFDFFVPIYALNENLDDWRKETFNTYILLKRNIEISKFRNKFTSFLKKKYNDVTYFVVEPLNSLNFYSESGRSKGDTAFINIFTIIATFLLLMACINYMNISTAQSANRAKEVGVKKAFGAKRHELIRQFLVESQFFSFISLIISIIIFYFSLSFFNGISGKNIQLYLLLKYEVIIPIIGITILTGLISGIYPAFYLSAFKPIKVLVGNLKSGSRSLIFRKLLFVFQFSLMISLIISSYIVYKQLQHLRDKKEGFDSQYSLLIPTDKRIAINFQAFKNSLTSNTNIINVGINFLTDSTSKLDPIINNHPSTSKPSAYPPNHLTVSIKPKNFLKTVNFLKSIWSEYYPNQSFSYRFSDSNIDNAFRSEERMASILYYSTILGAIISCLGLFGLSLFMAEQRKGEIAVRKVFGASSPRIYFMLVNEYMQQAFVANIIAWFFSYPTLNIWLHTYSSWTEMGWEAIFFTFAASILITLLTVSYQSIRAASANPVNALRYE
jgi:ABC-type antimicrobial peptide transport system permease subunit